MVVPSNSAGITHTYAKKINKFLRMVGIIVKKRTILGIESLSFTS